MLFYDFFDHCCELYFVYMHYIVLQKLYGNIRLFHFLRVCAIRSTGSRILTLLWPRARMSLSASSEYTKIRNTIRTRSVLIRTASAKRTRRNGQDSLSCRSERDPGSVSVSVSALCKRKLAYACCLVGLYCVRLRVKNTI